MADGPEDREFEREEAHEREMHRIERDEAEADAPNESGLADLARSLEYCKRVIV